jgi:23S rRNA (uracil1939-C5)-methyltransferase
VLVDPPRDGLATSVRKALLLRQPERLTYVSCHAATLARDLRELLTRYRLESLTLFDLFPQSGHMESVAQLVREAG